MRLARTIAVAHKEWREITRDRLYLTMAFLVPVMIMLVLGYGLSLDVEHIPFAVVDYDRSAESRDYIHRFADSRYFELVGHARDARELERLLADSRIRMGMVIPDQFQRRIAAGRPVAVQILIDGVFPYRAQTTKGYVAAINGYVNETLLARHLARTRGVSLEEARRQVRPVRLEPRYLYNQAVRSSWSMATGLVMLVLMVSPPFLTALGVVREKESGAIYNIYASTVTRGEFILGKLLPYVGVSLFNLMVLWWLAMAVFGAPFKGDPVFFIAASLVYIVCTAGIGLLVSILVRTQVAAVLVTMVITFVPAMLYSGMLVPVQSMSADAALTAHLLPPVYYLNLAWGSFLKGLGLRRLWTDVTILAAYAAVLWTVGYLAFTKRPRS